MAQKIQNKCPECGNTEFEIVKTLSKHTSMGHKAGHYRVKCTLCDFIETVKSKNPMQDAEQNPPEEMDELDLISYNKWLEENRSELDI